MTRTSSVEMATRFFPKPLPFPGLLSFLGGRLGGTRHPVETNLPFGGSVGGLKLDSDGSSSMESKLHKRIHHD